MDRVRFGRAIGKGTRQAARNLMEITAAAMAPDPSPAVRPAAPPPSAQSASMPSRQAVAEGGRRFSESFFSRLSRLGGALWLEFTGVFFGVFALVALQGVWRMRAAMHAGAALQQRQKLALAVVVAATFTYFCVSSFLRAKRRERGQHKRR